MSRDAQPSRTLQLVFAGSAAAVARGLVNGVSVLKISTQAGLPGSKMGIYPNFYWIRKQYGFKGFFRGIEPACAKAFLYSGVQFAAYHSIVNQLVSRGNPRDQPGLNYMTGVAVAGCIAGVAGTSVCHPLDVLKVRMSLATPGGPFSNLGSGIQTLTKEGLFKGLYRGYIPSVIGSAVYSAYLFTLLELARNLPWRRRRASPFIYFESIICPTVAVAGAYIAAHPFDVVRRKMMAQSLLLPKDGGVDLKFRNYLQMGMQMLKTNGFFGFYHGVLANMVKVVPQFAVFWAAMSALQQSNYYPLGMPDLD